MKILDTDTCVEILRGNQKVVVRSELEPDFLTTTSVTAAELYYGAAKSTAPEVNREHVTTFLGRLPVFDLGETAARIFGQFKAALQRGGHPLDDADLFIAAIVASHRATLVTGNRRHYERIPGMVLENWIR